MWRISLTLAYAGVPTAIIYAADASHGGIVFQMVNRIPGGDKLAHFILLGGMAFTLNVCFQCRRIRVYGWQFLWGSLLVFWVATLEEASQIWISSRTFDLVDWLANTMGILLLGPLAVRFIRAGQHVSNGNLESRS